MAVSTSEILRALGFDQDSRFQAYHRMVEIIGEEAADKLIREFPGESLYLPKLVFTYRVYAEMYQDWEGGSDYREIGRRYGYSRSQVRLILNKVRRSLYSKETA